MLASWKARRNHGDNAIQRLIHAIQKVRGVFILLLCTTAIASFAEAKQRGSRIETPLPHIVLITIDTLRADHLHCYGHDKIDTPNIDALADTGVLFSRAFAQIPLTLPSHSSIMTGTNPTYHQVRNNNTFRLSPGMTTLAEVVKDNGYRTGAFIGAFILDSSYGLDQGFDTYFDDFKRGGSAGTLEMERRGMDVVNQATMWIGRTSPNPFFVWLHLFDPHTPFDPPEPYRSRYPDSPYDGEIAYTDAVIGRFLDFLDKEGLREKTLIVLTSDHGESLGEHGEEYHGFFIYDCTLHVPLIVNFPKELPRGKVISTQVRSIDIMETILELVKIDLEYAGEFQGVSLVPLIREEGKAMSLPSYSESLLPRLNFGWSELKGVRLDHWKYIEAPKPELYDTRTDPGETTNLVDTNSQIAARMKEELLQIERLRPPEESSQRVTESLDPQTVRELMSLGYLVGSPSAEKMGDGTDPKDKIDEYSRFENAMLEINHMLDAGELDPAIDELNEMLKINQQSFETHYLLANAYRTRKDYARALKAYEAAIELNPLFSFAYIDMGRAYAEMGKIEDATEWCKKGLAIDPNSYYGELNLGVIYYDNKDLDLALEHLLKAKDITDTDPFLHSYLLSIYYEKDQVDRAIEELDTLIEMNFNPAENLTALGLIYKEQGEFGKAEEQFRKALMIDPQFSEGSIALARVQDIRQKKAQGYIRLRVIQVDSPALARTIIDELNKGTPFGQLAKEYSLDASRDSGGDLGYVKPGDLLAEVEKEAFSLKVGENSGIIVTPRGYFIVERID